MHLPSPPFLIAAIAGLAAGWWSVDSRQERPDTSSQTTGASGVSAVKPRTGQSRAPATSASSFYERMTTLANSGLSDPNSYRARISELKDKAKAWDSLSQATLHSLVNAWVKSDPAAAFEYAVAEHWQLENIGEQWADQDVKAALAAFEQLERSEPRNDLMMHAAALLARTDPAAALTIAKDPSYKSSRINKVFREFAKIDRARALSDALAIVKSSGQAGALDGVLGWWATSEPAAAAEWIRSSGLPNWDQAADSLVKEWAKTDPAAAAAFNREHLRSNGHYNMIQDWAKADPKGSLAHALAAPGHHRADLLTPLSLQLANTYPELAMKALLGGADPDAAEGVFRTLGNQDWHSAVQRAVELDDPAMQAAAAIGLLSSPRLYGDQIENKSTWVEQLIVLSADSGKFAPLGSAARHLTPDALERLVDSYGSGVLTGIDQHARSLARKSPEEASRFVDALPDSPQKSEAIQSVTAEWAKLEPNVAAEWVEQLDESKTRLVAVKNITNSWTRTHPASAREWIESLGSSPSRDAAILEWLSIRGARETTSSLDFAQLIGNDRNRSSAMTNVLSAMIQSDFEAATQTISTLDLPEAVAASAQEAIAREEIWRALAD